MTITISNSDIYTMYQGRKRSPHYTQFMTISKQSKLVIGHI